VPFAVMAAAVVGFGLYLWLVRLPAREAYFTERQLRALSVLAGQITSTLDGRLEAIERVAREIRPEGETLEKAMSVIPDVSYAKGCGQHADLIHPGRAIEVEHTYRRLPVTSPPQWSSLGAAQAVESKVSAQILFRYDSRSPTNAASTPTPAADGDRDESQAVSRTVTCGRSDLDRLIGRFIQDSSVAPFDVFLVDTGGRVVLEQGPAGLQLDRLRRRTEIEETKIRDGDKADPTTQALDMRRLAIEDLLSATAVHKVSIGQVDYKLFTQPLSMPPMLVSNTTTDPPTATTGTDPRPVWGLGALVPADQFAAEVQGVSLGSLSSVPLVGLLLLISLPLLKVFLNSSRARLTAADFRRIAASLVLSSGIGAVLVSSNLAYMELENMLDIELQAWSAKLQREFRNEVRAINTALDVFIHRWASPKVRKPSGGCDSCRVVQLYNQPMALHGWQSVPTPCPGESRLVACAGAVPGETLSEAILNEVREAYDGLRILVWSDRKERQCEKWTRDRQTTPLLEEAWQPRSFGERWSHEAWSWPEIAAPFLATLARAPTTGGILPLVEKRIIDESGTVHGFATLVPDMVSLSDPVAPPSFGFAVIEADGRVVFHSKSVRSLTENFLDEADKANEIRAALASHHARWVEGGYHGRRHRMFVQPLADTPWTLITFRDKELPRGIDLDVLMTWFIAFALYAVACAIVWFGLEWILTRGDNAWLWPNEELRAVYWHCVLVLAWHAVAMVVVLCGAGSSPATLLVVVAWLPMGAAAYVLGTITVATRSRDFRVGQRRRWLRNVSLAVVAGCQLIVAVTLQCWGLLIILPTVLWMTCGSRQPNTPTVHAARFSASVRRGYVACGMLLMTVCGVIPSLALYKDASDLGLGALVRHSQLRIAEQLAAREDAIRAKFESLWPAEKIQTRLADPRQLPAPGVFFGGCDPASQSSTCTRTKPSAATQSDSNRGGWLDLLLRDACSPLAFEETAERGKPCDSPGCLVRRRDGYTPLCELATRHLSGLIMAYLPAYEHSESIESRDMVFLRASDDRWQSTPDGNGLTLIDPRARSTGRVHIYGAAQPYRWGANVYTPWLMLGIIPVIFALYVVYRLFAWLARRIVALRDDLPAPGKPDWSAREFAQGLLLIRPAPAAVDGVAQYPGYFDLQRTRELDVDQHLRDVDVLPPSTLIVIDSLSYRFDDGEWNRRKLSLLEALVLGRRRRVVLISRVDPLTYLRNRMQSRADTKANEEYVVPEELDRWARVLERLMRIEPSDADTARLRALVERLRDGGTVADWAGGAKPRTTLVDECAPTARLRGIACELEAWHGAALTAETRSNLVVSAARAHYRAIWSLMTDVQRLLLVHLARDGFENLDERSWTVLRALLDRGLVHLDPGLCLMNESFRSFVRHETETEQEIRDWEKAEGPSAWDHLRDVLVPTTVLGGLLLFQTHPQLLTMIVGGLTAAGTAVAAVINLLSSMQTRGRGSGGGVPR